MDGTEWDKYPSCCCRVLWESTNPGGRAADEPCVAGLSLPLAEQPGGAGRGAGVWERSGAARSGPSAAAGSAYTAAS